MPTFSASALAIPTPATASKAAATAVFTIFFILLSPCRSFLVFPFPKPSAHAADELFQPFRSRRAENLVRGTFFLNAAVVQIEDMARDLAGELHLVRNEDHSAP